MVPSRSLPGFRELSGDETVNLVDRAVEAFPPYADYQRRTERVIPVLIATRSE